MRSARKNKGAAPRRAGARLGQHFLTGTWAARKLAEAVQVRADETILEIGPGKGALTRELLATGRPVVAIEKDEALVAALREIFPVEVKSGQLTIVEGDIRNFLPESWKLTAGSYVVAANIPYYITGEIIRQFLTAKIQPRAMALLVQKEVAERIVARDGKESILSLSVKVFGTPKIIAKVSRGNFSPPPSVDSAVLLIEDISRDFFKDLDEQRFFDVIHAGFSSKRKQLLGNLKKKFGVHAEQAMGETGLMGKIRAEDVRIEAWKQLTLKLAKLLKADS